MTNLTQKSSKQFPGAAMRVATLALFLATFGASAALAQTRGYVTNNGDDTVSVIDPATNSVVGPPITVGSRPTAVAVTPNGAFAYVVNQSSNNVSVISATTSGVVATVPVGHTPTDIAITPNGAFAYVVNNADGTVSVINTADDSVTTPITIARAFSIAITPSGAVAYVSSGDFISGSVTVIDTATNAVITTLSIGRFPTEMAVTPNGAFLYVTDFSDSNLFVINTATNAVATVPIGSSRAIAITPNGAFAYVALVTGPISVIDTTNNSQVTTVNVGASLNVPVGQMAVGPTGTSVYVPVADFFNSHVSVISTATNVVVTQFLTGNRPAGVAFATSTHGPTNKDQCKNDGWATFTNPSFKNQGQCIKFVNHMDEPEH